MRFQDEVFPQLLQKSLNELRSLDLSYDVTIRVEDKEFPAHKSVLAAVSPYFRAMFNVQGSFKESKEDKVTLHDVDSDAMLDILKFIYTSVIEITDKNAFLLMESSHLLQIHALRMWISHFLQSTMTAENCLSIYVMAHLHDYYDLAKNSWRFILLNFSQVAEGDEFLQVPFNVLLEIVSSELLNVTDENALLKYVVNWIKADPNNRKDYVEELLKKIVMANIPVQSLTEIKNDQTIDAVIGKKIEHFISKKQATKYESKDSCRDMLRYGSEQGVLLAIGGESSGVASRNVECFTLGFDSWKCVIPQHVKYNAGPQNMNVIPAMRCARYNSAVASDFYNVYVIGGRNSSGYLDECETYDIKKNRWKSLRNLPCKVEGSGAVILEGRLVVVGGRNDCGSTDKAWEWDEKHSVWKNFPPLNSPRSFHGTLAVAGNIYVIGGFDSDNYSALKTVERYDTYLKKWSEIRCMHNGRAKFGFASVDNYIYVIGGVDGHWSLKSVERYDFTINEWSHMTSMSVPRHSFSAAVCNGKIYCIGGSDAIHYLNNVEKFNPKTNRWHYEHSLKMSRLGLVSATLLVPCIVSRYGN